jgi:glycosyltransferase involved in cell wall biosynthesis
MPSAWRLPRAERLLHHLSAAEKSRRLSALYDSLYGSYTVRVLFFNVGNLGTHALGHGQLDEALRAGLAGTPDMEARFAGLAPMGRVARAAAHRRIEPLARTDLDFAGLRWQVVQSLRAREAVGRELRAWPADVVHMYSHTIAFAMPGRMSGTPVVVSTDTAVRDWWAMPAWRRTEPYARVTIEPSRVLERHALRRAALVLARTAWTRQALEREAPGLRVLEHHPGIDLIRYRPAPRRERPRAKVLFIGGRFIEKGGEDLIAALGDELGRDIDLDIVTHADVPERPGVRIHRLIRSDPQLLDLQQQADVFCMPTYGDTNPWSILEAMACGTPVISSRVGGIPNMLDDGGSGVFAPYGDPRVLGEALRALIADRGRRAQLAARARARCEVHYDARQQGPRLVELFRETTSAARPGSAAIPAG